VAEPTWEDWRRQAEAARRVAELMEDPVGKRAMLDIADACEQLAQNPRLARVARVWPDVSEVECPQADLPAG
jgi:hypothetical protein